MNLLASIKLTLRRERTDAEMQEEMRAHMAARADDLMNRGMDEATARRRAFVEFGAAEALKEQVRERRRFHWLEQAAQDTRYALRAWRKNPGYALVAIAILALGVGANTAIFSAVNALLLRPLPYAQPEQLVKIETFLPAMHAAANVGPDYMAWRQQSRSFEGLAAFTFSDVNLTGRGDPVRAAAGTVTRSLLPTLGVVPMLGRNFSADEDRPGGPQAVLLSYKFWREQLHADRNVVGTALVLNGSRFDFTVVGVLGPSFRFPAQAEPDLLLPLQLDPATTITPAQPVTIIDVIGRMRAGLSAADAQSELQRVQENVLKTYPAGWMGMVRGATMQITPLKPALVGDVRLPLLIVLVAGGFLLLLVCANIANLQLARAVTRHHELAVRGALGASRGRMGRQLLTESLALAAAGSLAGLGVAFWTTRLIARVPVPAFKHFYSANSDWRIFGFTALLAAVAGILFGMAPAASAWRANVSEALRSATARITPCREHKRLREGLLIAEVTLAVVLLISAGLLIRSFEHLMHVDAGFDPTHTVTAATMLTGAAYNQNNGEKEAAFVNQLLPRLQALPGVDHAAVASSLPLQGFVQQMFIAPEGEAPPPNGMGPIAGVTVVTPDYFGAIGAVLTAGRSFSAADNGAAAQVAIANQTLARKVFHGDALGKRFRYGRPPQSVQIVGIMADLRHAGLDADPVPEAYRPFAQSPQPAIHIVLRTGGAQQGLAAAIRRAVAEVDATQPVYDVQGLDEVLAESVAQRRFTMLLLASFATLAIILAAIGVYGVMAYGVSQRRQEFGIRVALGASRQAVVTLVLRRALWLLLAGEALGIAAALAVSHSLRSLLFGVGARDVPSFAAGALSMALVAFGATLVPAYMAARADPMAALRAE